MIIGKKIEEAVIQSGYKTQDVAAYVGVSYAKLLSFYKLDSIELKYLRKIAQKLNLPLSYFLAELSPPSQPEKNKAYLPTELHQVKENIQILHRHIDLCHAEMDRLKKELSKTMDQITFVMQGNKINSLFIFLLLI